MAAGEIHRASVPLNGDSDIDIDIDAAVEIVFEDTLSLVFAIRPRRDLRMHLPFTVIEDILHRLQHRIQAVFLHQPDYPVFAHLTGADHRIQVPFHGVGEAIVARQQVDNVAAHLPFFADFDGRQSKALLPDFRGR